MSMQLWYPTTGRLQGPRGVPCFPNARNGSRGVAAIDCSTLESSDSALKFGETLIYTEERNCICAPNAFNPPKLFDEVSMPWTPGDSIRTRSLTSPLPPFAFPFKCVRDYPLRTADRCSRSPRTSSDPLAASGSCSYSSDPCPYPATTSSSRAPGPYPAPHSAPSYV